MFVARISYLTFKVIPKLPEAAKLELQFVSISFTFPSYDSDPPNLFPQKKAVSKIS